MYFIKPIPNVHVDERGSPCLFFLFRPERNDMQAGHDEIIALLNQKMADKAR